MFCEPKSVQYANMLWCRGLLDVIIQYNVFRLHVGEVSAYTFHVQMIVHVR